MVGNPLSILQSLTKQLFLDSDAVGKMWPKLIIVNR